MKFVFVKTIIDGTSHFDVNLGFRFSHERPPIEAKMCSTFQKIIIFIVTQKCYYLKL